MNQEIKNKNLKNSNLYKNFHIGNKKITKFFNDYKIWIGLFSFLLSIYGEYCRNKGPEINYHILGSTRLIELKEKVGLLDIRYNKQSILKKNKTLSLVLLKISNDGSKGVAIHDYDPKSPLGIKIEKGEVLEKPILIQSSSNITKSRLAFNIFKKKEIHFSNFIFDKDEYFVVKILVLHSENEKPIISSVGKIFGVKKINVIVDEEQNNIKMKKSMISKIFDENIFVYFARFFIYLISFMFIMFSISILIFLPYSILKKKFFK